MRLRLLVVLAAGLSLLLGCSSEDPPEDRAVTPGSSAGLGRAVDRAVGSGTGRLAALRSVLVHHAGKRVVERHYAEGPEATANTASVTKSVLGALVGIAVEEGRLTLDQRLDESLPGHADRMRPEVASITVRELLTMTAGLPPDTELDLAEFRTDDWVGEILDRGATGRKGEFAYSSVTSHVLGAVLAEAVGTSLLEYADRRLFRPIGIDLRGAATPVVSAENVPEYDEARFAWPTDPSGLTTGFAFLKLRPADLERLGLLYLHGGSWDGRQVVPADWVEESTTDKVDGTAGDGLGYGYHWWTGEVGGHHAFGALGLGGQLVEVVPDLELVVVATSDIDGEQRLDGVALAGRLNRALLPVLEPA